LDPQQAALLEGWVYGQINRWKGDLMAGEIREALRALREKRQLFVTGLLTEMNEVGKLYDETGADGSQAVKLIHGEVSAYRAEIAEIRAEFAEQSNGGPPGPLPGSPDSGEKRAVNFGDLHPSMRAPTSQHLKT
jgi:hypothetical protein